MVSPNQSKTWRWVDRVVLLVALGLFAWFYRGFFFIDPRTAYQHSAQLLLVTARVGLPLLAVGMLFLYWAVRRGRVHRAVLGLMAAGGLFALLLGYPMASYLQDRSYLPKEIEQYHPFLQLAPFDVNLRESPGGKRPLRVFCVGGSTTEFKPHDGRGWPTRVQELLSPQVASGEDLQVYNLGRQWYTSAHTLINYSLNLHRYRPDVLVVMHAINDLIVNCDFSSLSAGPFRDDYRHFHGAVYRLISRPTVFQTASRFFHAIWYHHPREVVDTTDFPGLPSFERNLETLIALARTDGTRVVLMTQPSLYKEELTPGEDRALRLLHFSAVGPKKKWSTATALRGMRAYNEVTRRVADREGLTLIDLAREVPKSLDIFYDDVHYRDAAFDTVARRVAEGLRPVLSRRTGN